MRASTLFLSILFLVSLVLPFARLVVVRAENCSSSVFRNVRKTVGLSSLRQKYRSSLPIKQTNSVVVAAARDNNKDNGDIPIQERSVKVSSSRFEVRSSFLGVSYNATFDTPADPACAASETTLVGAVNTAIEIRNKKGKLLFQQNLNEFYDSLGNLATVYDPKIAYDEYKKRFVVIALNLFLPEGQGPDDRNRARRRHLKSKKFTGNSTILLAVSKSSSPTKKTDWYFQAINSREYDGDEYLWADYPGLGISPEAVYITTEAFTFDDFSFVGTRLRIIAKSSFYAGKPISYTSHEPYKGRSQPGITRPAMVRGGPIGNKIGTYLVAYDGDATSLVVTTVKDPLTSPKFSLKKVALGTKLLSPPSPVPQLGSSLYKLDAGDDRALDATWRDNNLWSTNTIAPKSGPNAKQATSYWVRINTMTFKLMDQGEIGGEDIAAGSHTSYASVAVNKFGDAAFGFSAFGRLIYPGAYVVGRHPNDLPGTVSSSFVVHEGVDLYHRNPSNLSRWGDYSCTAVDPMDESFWVFNEFADKRGYRDSYGSGVWTTAWANFASTKTGKNPPKGKKAGKNPPRGKKTGKNPPINKTTRRPGSKATKKAKGTTVSPKTSAPHRIKGAPRSNRMLRQ